MLEQVSYVNHLNEVLYFGMNDFYVNLNTLHDFYWDYVSKNDRLSGFERKIHTKSMPVRIGALSEEDGIKKRNELFEIPEKDIIAGIPGRLIVNGYYLPCYITASSKSYYSIEGKFLSCDITITSDETFWIREEEPQQVEYDEEIYFTSPSPFPADFRLAIYGGTNAVNPGVVLDGHVYQVYVTIPIGKRLVIDSLQKKVYMATYSQGEEQEDAVSVFGNRNKESYIFEKINPKDSGRISIVTLSGDTELPISFDLMYYLPRSEPKWTHESDQLQNWLYEIDYNRDFSPARPGRLFETTYTYFRPSGIEVYEENGHLIQAKSKISNVMNYLKLENGRLIVYHD